MKGRAIHGRQLREDIDEICDVAIVGSGAGGGMLAEGLVQAGLDVVMIEAGGFQSRRDFTLREGEALPLMYQGRGLQGTDDLSILVLQGRTVGGTTTINWTTCFRTPERVLEHWRQRHDLELGDLSPHFEAEERRLSIAPWPPERANANNRALLDGAQALGWEAAPLRRNVQGCANTGYCGLGCPVDGKQSQLVTTIPAALEAGLRLYSDMEVEQLLCRGRRAELLSASALNPATGQKSGPRLSVLARVVVVAGGALHSPALLLRSGLSRGPVGQRTFLHPVVGLRGRMPHAVEGWAGAPQSIGSHQHIDRGPGRVGFFIEAAPLQPMAAALPGSLIGAALRQHMADLPRTAFLIALHVDGLVEGDEGGRVWLDSAGRRRFDYPISPPLQEALPHSHRALAELLLAAGAEELLTFHRSPLRLQGPADLSALSSAPYGAHHHSIFSAHVMGGCAMGTDLRHSVVGPDLRHHDIENLFVVDGSVLPTALGVNPSQTIYALAHRARATVQAAAA